MYTSILDFLRPPTPARTWWHGAARLVLLWRRPWGSRSSARQPHKPSPAVWEWMIRRCPAAFITEAIFPRRGHHPSEDGCISWPKDGFSQSYTYFTWRDGKHETDSTTWTELTTPEPKEFYPPAFLRQYAGHQSGVPADLGPPGLPRSAPCWRRRYRACFGVYSGFETLRIGAATGGAKEYLDSEKYEIRPRDHAAPGNTIADITLLNRLAAPIRRCRPTSTRSSTQPITTNIICTASHPPMAAR